MATEETKTLMESSPMKGGDGPLSYAQNSSLQRMALDTSKNLMTEVIADKLDIKRPVFESCNKFQIADLGCSVGPNAYIAVQNIIDAVEHKYKSNQQNCSTPELQVYFNDQASNDFNTLFRNLPQPRRYFAAGVPGSFYCRLFPKSTIHLVHSSSSLHWLSRVPREVVDKNSPAWNKERIYCGGTEPKVAKAFAAQFQKDMEDFLNARAEEVVEGGLMVLQFGGLRDGGYISQTAIGKLNDVLGSCLIDMAEEGLISEEKLNSFNVPLYLPTIKELEKIIERNGNYSIEIMEGSTYSTTQILSSPEKWALLVRAGSEELVRNHFGNDIVEELFESFTNKLVRSGFTGEENNNGGISLFIVLKHKSN